MNSKWRHIFRLTIAILVNLFMVFLALKYVKVMNPMLKVVALLIIIIVVYYTINYIIFKNKKRKK